MAIKGEVGRYAFRALRSTLHLRPVRLAFTWWMVNMSDFLPVQKISETKALLCFYHPQPVYPIHILLVPKEDIRDLSQLAPKGGGFLTDLLETVGKLVEELNLQEKGYRLIVNGGPYQEFPHLHFHLVSGELD